MMAMSTKSCRLLLLEPEFVMRRTVTSLARDMCLAEVVEVTSLTMAKKVCLEQNFDAILMTLDDRGECLVLLQQLRKGNTTQRATVPVASIVTECTEELARILKELKLTRVLIKPIKVRDILNVIASLASKADANASLRFHDKSQILSF